MPKTDGVWIYSIIRVEGRVTVSLCGDATNWEESDMDTIIQVFQGIKPVSLPPEISPHGTTVDMF